MTRQTRGRQIDWRRAPSLTTALIDVDLALTNIVFQQGPSLEGPNGRRPRADHAIECVTRLPGEDLDSEAETHLVYLSGYAHSDRLDWDEDFDPRSVCYIATDRRPGHAWRTSIFIESFIFRRVVELFTTKRIDAARISILVKALRGSSGAIEVPTIGAPMMKSAGATHGQHSRGHLMSVQTSLIGETEVRPASILFQSKPRTAVRPRRAHEPTSPGAV